MKTPHLPKSKKFKPKQYTKKSPKNTKETVVFSHKNLQFPKNFRFITEQFQGTSLKKATVLLISMLVLAVALVSLDLFFTLAKTAYTKHQYSVLQQEKVYWQQVVQKYPGYKDATMHLAAVYYQLGEKEQAKLYVQKTLQLDPNDATAQSLSGEIE